MFKFKAPPKQKRRLFSSSVGKNSNSDDDEEGEKRKYFNDDDAKNNNNDYDADVDVDNPEKRKKSSIIGYKKKRKTSATNGALSFTSYNEDGDDQENEGDFEDSAINYGKVSNRSAASSSKKKDKKKKKRTKQSRPTKGGLGFGGANILSHLNEDDDDENDGENGDIDHESVSKKGNKRSRFGMGTLGTSIVYDEDECDNHDQNFDRNQDDQYDTYTATSSLYDKEALEKLKASQKTMKQPINNKDKSITEHTASTSDGKNGGLDSSVPLPPKPTTMQKPKPPPVNEEPENFIPLDSSITGNPYASANLTIVTGDKALMYTGELDDDGDNNEGINKANLGTDILSNVSDAKKSNSTRDDLLASVGAGENANDQGHQNIEVDEGGRKWEEEIARRAGVSADIYSNNTSSMRNVERPGSTVIEDVKRTIRSTLQNLTQMDLDLESNIGRRGHDENLSKEDATKKEQELDHIGKKFEYYQNLRVKLADWIGALRFVAERVTMVEIAIHKLNDELSAKSEKMWREWEDDVISSLKDRDLLDYVVGRQPEVEAKNDNYIVDEFGRDRRSLESLARTKRENQRRRIRTESKDRRRAKQNSKLKEQNEMSCGNIFFDDTDLDLSDNEVMDREERRSALSDAVGVVMEEMDDDYSTPLKLISAFDNWQSQYLDDFDQCYAKLTFVELMNVFVRSESCQKVDFLCYVKKEGDSIYTNFDKFSWFKALQQFQQKNQDSHDTKQNNNDNERAKTTFVEVNEVVPKLFDALLSTFHGSEGGIGSYNPYSEKQTKSIISFVRTLGMHMANEEQAQLEELSETVFQHINDFVQNQAFPVIKTKQVGIELDDTFRFATIGQLHRLKKLLCNLLEWYDILKGEAQLNLAKFCLLDLVAYRLLPILNRIGDNLEKQFKARSFLKEIQHLIERKGFFESKDLTLSSAPLRAALSRID